MHRDILRAFYEMKKERSLAYLIESARWTAKHYTVQCRLKDDKEMEIFAMGFYASLEMVIVIMGIEKATKNVYPTWEEIGSVISNLNELFVNYQSNIKDIIEIMKKRNVGVKEIEGLSEKALEKYYELIKKKEGPPS